MLYMASPHTDARHGRRPRRTPRPPHGIL